MLYVPLAVVAVEDVPEVHVHFAREEERVRRRERRDRPARAFGHEQPVGRAHDRQTVRLGSAELMLLRMPAGVAPVTRGIVAVENPFSPASYL